MAGSPAASSPNPKAASAAASSAAALLIAAPSPASASSIPAPPVMFSPAPAASVTNSPVLTAPVTFSSAAPAAIPASVIPSILPERMPYWLPAKAEAWAFICASSSAGRTLPCEVIFRTWSPFSPMASRISSIVSLEASALSAEALETGTRKVISAPRAATAFSWSSLDCSIISSRRASSESSS